METDAEDQIWVSPLHKWCSQYTPTSHAIENDTQIVPAVCLYVSIIRNGGIHSINLKQENDCSVSEQN